MQERRTLLYLEENELPSTAMPIFNYDSSGFISSCNITPGVTKIKCFWVPGYNRIYMTETDYHESNYGQQIDLNSPIFRFMMYGESDIYAIYYTNFYLASLYENNLSNNYSIGNQYISQAYRYNYYAYASVFPIRYDSSIDGTWSCRFFDIDTWEGKYAKLNADALKDGVPYLTIDFQLLDIDSSQKFKELYPVYFEPYEQ